MGRLRDCARGIAIDLEELYGFELSVREASQAAEAGTKALKRGLAAQDAAAAADRKAAALADERRRDAGQAAAQKALAKVCHTRT